MIHGSSMYPSSAAPWIHDAGIHGTHGGFRRSPIRYRISVSQFRAQVSTIIYQYMPVFGFQYMSVFPGPNSNSGFTSNRMGPGVPGPEGNPYYTNISYLFTYIYACFAASAASPAPTHPSIKESTTVGRAPKAPAPLLWRRPKAASFMDGCVGAGEAADAAKHA